MKKLMTKKVNVFGKGVPVFVIAMIAFMGLATAALMPYFGQITGNAVVNQGLSVDDKPWNEPVIDELGPIYSSVGGLSSSMHVLKNAAGEDTDATLTRTSCTRDGGWPHSCDEITTSFWGYADYSEERRQNQAQLANLSL